MRWDELATALAARTRRRIDDRTILVGCSGQGIVVSTFATSAVALVTLEIFLGRTDHTPYELLPRAARFPIGAPIVVGKRWLLRTSLPLAGLAIATFDAVAEELATAASRLAFRPPAPMKPEVAKRLFDYLC